MTDLCFLNYDKIHLFLGNCGEGGITIQQAISNAPWWIFLVPVAVFSIMGIKLYFESVKRSSVKASK